MQRIFMRSLSHMCAHLSVLKSVFIKCSQTHNSRFIIVTIDYQYNRLRHPWYIAVQQQAWITRFDQQAYDNQRKFRLPAEGYSVSLGKCMVPLYSQPLVVLASYLVRHRTGMKQLCWKESAGTQHKNVCNKAQTSIYMSSHRDKLSV